MDCKAAGTTGNNDDAFGPGAVKECTVQWDSRSFAKATKAVKMSIVASHGSRQ